MSKLVKKKKDHVLQGESWSVPGYATDDARIKLKRLYPSLED